MIIKLMLFLIIIVMAIIIYIDQNKQNNEQNDIKKSIKKNRDELEKKLNDLINWKNSQKNKTDTIVKNRFCINSRCFTNDQLLKSLTMTNRLFTSGGPVWSQQYSNTEKIIVGDQEKAHVIIVGRTDSWGTGEIIAERKEGNNYVVKSKIPWSKVHWKNHNPIIFIPPGETWRIKNTSNGSKWMQVYKY